MRGCKGVYEGAYRVKTERASLLISLVLASVSEVQFCARGGVGEGRRGGHQEWRGRGAWRRGRRAWRRACSLMKALEHWP